MEWEPLPCPWALGPRGPTREVVLVTLVATLATDPRVPAAPAGLEAATETSGTRISHRTGQDSVSSHSHHEYISRSKISSSGVRTHTSSLNKVEDNRAVNLFSIQSLDLWRHVTLPFFLAIKLRLHQLEPATGKNPRSILQASFQESKQKHALCS